MKGELKGVLKFLIVGGTATFIDFCIYFVLSQRINVSVAKFISLLISCTYSFFLNKAWTFRVKEKANAAYVLKYILSQGVNISVNVLTNYMMLRVSGEKLVSYVVATGAGMTVNFLLQRFFVFKGSERK